MAIQSKRLRADSCERLATRVSTSVEQTLYYVNINSIDFEPRFNNSRTKVKSEAAAATTKNANIE